MNNALRRYLPALLILAFAAPAVAGTHAVPVTRAGQAGSATAIAGWKIQSSAKVRKSGKTVSSADVSTKGWYPIGARSTVMAGLIANGRYPHVLRGDALRAVNDQDFEVPWWYRTRFRVAASHDVHTFIRIKGIIPSAEIWLNGRKIADRTQIAGAFTLHTLDVSDAVHAGTNTLAIKVDPANPERDLAIGWIDWNPTPPDRNMGIWRDVEIVRSGPVSLHDARVTTRLALPKMERAAVTAKVQVRNNTDAARAATISGTIAGVSVQRRVHLQANQTRTLTFSPQTDSGLALEHPRVWWPVGLGDHPLYHLQLAVKSDDTLSDRAKASFGIRDVRSRLTADGYRQFIINGMPLLIRGAGWTPDLFLRDNPERLDRAFRHVQNLGLNTIRVEGHLGRDDFYRRADRDGILVIAGWECCDKWEAWAGTGGEPWDAHDHKVAAASARGEARLLRNHPSVIAFLIGSDNAPPKKIANAYVDALHSADWPNPIIAAAAAATTQPTGPSGMKMSGPYAWVPPNYWYGHKSGAAFGFNAETSAGINIPTLESLEQDLSSAALKALWQDFDARQFHAAPAWSRFSKLTLFDRALARRQGKPTSLADYVAKAQLANYANSRAQFEAYSARMNAAKPATGVIYWMLNSNWPSLHWHLFTEGLEPAGAYYGAQKANEPLHIQYDYGNRGVVLVNHTRRDASQLEARVRVRDLDGRVRYDRTLAHAKIAANHARRIVMLPKPESLSDVYFVELTLSRNDEVVSRNVYWLARKPDVLDWDKSNWFTTPTQRYADLTALQKLPTATIEGGATTHRDGGTAITTVTLSNPADASNVALFEHVSIRRGDNGNVILPVYWDRNDVTLWPGESVALTARYPAAALKKARPTIRIGGWNTKSLSIRGNGEPE